MIGKKASVTCFAFLSILLCVSISVQVVVVSCAFQVGGWVKYDVRITPVLAKEVTPTSITIRFVSIEGTNMTVQATIHLSDGDEWKQTSNIDLVFGSNTGLIIPSNSKVGDLLYIKGYGNVSIEREAAAVYTGMRRAIVSARFSNSTDSFTFFWDKLTGVMLEQNVTQDESTMIYKIADTNIWQTQINSYPSYESIIYLAIVLGIVIASVVFLMMRRGRPQKRASKTGRAAYGSMSGSLMGRG